MWSTVFYPDTEFSVVAPHAKHTLRADRRFSRDSRESREKREPNRANRADRLRLRLSARVRSLYLKQRTGILRGDLFSVARSTPVQLFAMRGRLAYARLTPAAKPHARKAENDPVLISYHDVVAAARINIIIIIIVRCVSSTVNHIAIRARLILIKN